MTTRSLLEATGRFDTDLPLGPLTTYKVGGPARFSFEASSEDDLLLAAEFAKEHALEVFVLGRGSNVVVSDSGFDGLVLRLGEAFVERSISDEGIVTAGGAVPLPLLARETARAGRAGLEFFTGIPGSVGGAVKMNAGCHGSEASEWLLSARVVDLGTARASIVSVEDLAMGYRRTALPDDAVVVSAQFRTVPGDPAESEVLIRDITRWRKENQPGGTLNAGSVFKNPTGDSAGRLIDSLGLKGFRHGSVEVSQRHANFFVADGGATAADLYTLVELVRTRVASETGVILETEMRFIGEFS